MKISSILVLFVLLTLALPFGVYAQEVDSSSPGSESSSVQDDENLSSFMEEVSQFQEETESSLSAMESAESVSPVSSPTPVPEGEYSGNGVETNQLLSILVNVCAVLLGAILALAMVYSLFR